jgi:hypothetical protein
VQQGAAVIAAPLLSAERFGPAGDDVGDGAVPGLDPGMRWQHRRAVSLHIAAPETAERVRHFGHASEAAHHLVEQLAQRHPRRFRQMRVNRRRGDVLVAEKRLDDAGVDPLLEEPGRIGVTQRVRRSAATAGKIGRLDGLGSGHGWRRDRFASHWGRASRDRGGPWPATSAAGLRAPPWARARPVPCCAPPSLAFAGAGSCRRRAGRHWF